MTTPRVHYYLTSRGQAQNEAATMYLSQSVRSRRRRAAPYMQQQGSPPAQAAAFSPSTFGIKSIPRHVRVPIFLSAAGVDNGADVDDRSVRHREFRDWCDSVGILAPNLEHAPTDGGIPGLTVRPGTSLNAGEAAIVLPLDATLAVLAGDGDDGADSSVRSSSVLSDELWSEAPMGLRLASRLLHERSLGGSSRWHGYILHGLPPVSGPGRERCDALGRWTDAELSLLRSPALKRKAEDRRRTDDEWFRRLTEDRSAAAPSACFTREEFDWAMDVVRTRHFRGDFAPGLRHGAEERKDDYALLPFVDDLNHRPEISKNFRPKSSNESLGIDYSPQFVTVSEALNRTSKAICWVAHRPFQDGEEVALMYLTGTGAIAEAFLDEWGFVLSANEMNACAVYVGGIRCIVRRDGSFYEEDSMMDVIEAEVQQHFNSDEEDGKAKATGNSWRLVAKACYNEFLLFEGCAKDISVLSYEETASPSRHNIANMFVEGKQRLLYAGLQHALLRADEE
eukprot:CAMPEP_0113580258 /NCGR_PEP_ID=MMETSP0015_2-20120614/30569_1 /TAXON_ID=2838 /ORGANISM="Odontella" /LENGTH=508 /DNA_ID=CAMNT_0000484419 /DNA_START=54 /DNA_END=1581 /DNA_ORIENTATION=- /assembly_acc=CAM_ASM_000160